MSEAGCEICLFQKCMTSGELLGLADDMADVGIAIAHTEITTLGSSDPQDSVGQVAYNNRLMESGENRMLQIESTSDAVM